MIYIRDPEHVKSALEDLLSDEFQGDDYTIRLFLAEAKLESLGYVRCCDGEWRKKITAAEIMEMKKLRDLAGERSW